MPTYVHRSIRPRVDVIKMARAQQHEVGRLEFHRGSDQRMPRVIDHQGEHCEVMRPDFDFD
eukprot:8933113-Pyramimonas_sp.AAC.1